VAVETRLSVRLWADKTFGPVRDTAALLARARLELDERQETARLARPSEIGQEAADVVILLHRLAALHGLDLEQGSDAKMEVNRRRSWVPDGSGVGRHA